MAEVTSRSGQRPAASLPRGPPALRHGGAGAAPAPGPTAQAPALHPRSPSLLTVPGPESRFPQPPLTVPGSPSRADGGPSAAGAASPHGRSTGHRHLGTSGWEFRRRRRRVTPRRAMTPRPRALVCVSLPPGPPALPPSFKGKRGKAEVSEGKKTQPLRAEAASTVRGWQRHSVAQAQYGCGLRRRWFESRLGRLRGLLPVRVPAEAVPGAAGLHDPPAAPSGAGLPRGPFSLGGTYGFKALSATGLAPTGRGLVERGLGGYPFPSGSRRACSGSSEPPGLAERVQWRKRPPGRDRGPRAPGRPRLGPVSVMAGAEGRGAGRPSTGPRRGVPVPPVREGLVCERI